MVASAPCTSSVLRALSMQVWPVASSGWPTAWLGPADLDSAGFSAVGRSGWVFGSEPYFAKYSSPIAQREELRGYIGSALAVVMDGEEGGGGQHVVMDGEEGE